MSLQITAIEPQLKRDNGLFIVDVEATPLPPSFEIKEKLVIYLPPNQVGGNHVHWRTEVLIGIGAGLELHWIDSNGETHIEPMNPSGKLYAITVGSSTPHAVLNRSGSFAILIEYANGDLSDAQPVAVIPTP
jgi:hypothetical protein